MKTALTEGETLLRHGAANMWRGIEAVGGRLYLTSERLVFESHGFNIQTGVTIIELPSISAVRTRRTLMLIPNGIELLLEDGTTQRFVVWRRAQWLSAITRARSRPAA